MKIVIDKNTVVESAQVLGLNNRASIKDIKEAYKTLMQEWHPDTCKEKKDTCKKMAQKITQAYSVLIEYSENCVIDFSGENISKKGTKRDQEEFWKEHFGSDPLWGGR